jgi:hypothetical protein
MDPNYPGMKKIWCTMNSSSFQAEVDDFMLGGSGGTDDTTSGVITDDTTSGTGGGGTGGGGTGGNDYSQCGIPSFAGDGWCDYRVPLVKMLQRAFLMVVTAVWKVAFQVLVVLTALLMQQLLRMLFTARIHFIKQHMITLSVATRATQEMVIAIRALLIKTLQIAFMMVVTVVIKLAFQILVVTHVVFLFLLTAKIRFTCHICKYYNMHKQSLNVIFKKKVRGVDYKH